MYFTENAFFRHLILLVYKCIRMLHNCELAAVAKKPSVFRSISVSQPCHKLKITMIRSSLENKDIDPEEQDRQCQYRTTY